MPIMITRSTLHQSLRLLMAAIVVGSLLFATQSRDSFADATRPVLLSTLNTFGIHSTDTGEALLVGHLTVPWTSDCSGINLLAILLALTVWVNRSAKADWRFWLRIAAVFPLSLLANVLRVLTIIGYRALFEPDVESPQLHYFIGFLWLVPMILIITPRDGSRFLTRFLETLHAAAVLAWLSPMISSPGGAWIAVAAILLLSQCRFDMDAPALRMTLTAGWLLGGLAIGLFSFESIWLGWLLACPLMWPLRLLRSPVIWLTLAATQPLLLMLPYGDFAAACVVGWMAWQSFTAVPSENDRSEGCVPMSWRIASPVIGLALCLPFTASTLFASAHHPLLPPAGLVLQEIGAHGYELKLPAEIKDIRLVWYAAQNNDRHHTVKVCLKYRGRDIHETAEQPSVFTDGRNWLREFFIQDGQLLTRYADYARSTLAPRSDPGAHLIFVAEEQTMTPSDFESQAQTLAHAIHLQIQPQLALKP